MSLMKLFNVQVFNPSLNIGCLLDIPYGRYMEGVDGEMILNGGMPGFLGIAGEANTYKSQLAQAINLRVMERYDPHYAIIYDTESTSYIERWIALAEKLTTLDTDVVFDPENMKVGMSDGSLTGNRFFENLKTYINQKIDEKTSLMRDTPFIDKTGKTHRVLSPSTVALDSISSFSVDALDAIYDKNELGESGLNAVALNSARYKSQLISQLPSLAKRGSLYCTVNSHVGKEIKMEKYAPAGKTLAQIPTNLKFKNVSENFSFLTGITYYTFAPETLRYTDKTCEWPLSTKETYEGDNDLQKVKVIALRGKGGPTGSVFELVYSQRDGLLIGLSELNHLKRKENRSIRGMDYKKIGFGLTGKDGYNFSLELYPDTVLRRTDFRRKWQEDPRLQRALTITTELQQLYSLWNLDEHYLCSPAQLRQDIIQLGYDWNRLLDSRGYWTFKDMKPQRPYLSTMDLLRMRVGEYTPKWYKPESVKKTKATRAKVEAESA